MNVVVEKRYMMLPVGTRAQKKKLLLKKDGVIRVELDLRLSADPDFIMPYDLREYIGEAMTLETIPCIDFYPIFADAPDNSTLYREKYRPATHFTASRGWINDPNGLVFYEGKYHLFFQHNPADTCWGNMHWGHAVSRDLVHWEEKQETLFPDDTGTMYSGSAIIDEDNRTGLRNGEHVPLLLFYTAAGGSGLMNASAHFEQRMAYSLDGGETFVKYDRPVVRHIAESNRDPKVIYCDEINAFIMALYLRGREFVLLRSDNLLDWVEIQRICLENDDECPDFYPLNLDGERFWVLSGAHDRYLVGKMEGAHFVPIQSPGRLHYGKNSYAAQSFSNLASGRRVRLAWNRGTIPDMPFNSAMTTPHDMSLKRIDGKIALCAWPSSEFGALRGALAEGTGRVPLTAKAHDIVLSVPAQGVHVARFLGFELTIDTEKMRVGRGADEDGWMNVRAENGRIDLRVVQDVHAVEVYSSVGDATLCFAHVSDYMLNSLECEGARMRVWPLENIWEAKA